MPTPLPNLGAKRSLEKLGVLAKQTGPGVFAPTQAPRPVAPSYGGMGIDPGRLSMPSGLGGFGGGLGSPFGGIGMPGMVRPGFGRGGQAGTPQPGQPGFGGGPVGSFDGGLSVLNQFDQSFQAAAAQHGFDPNWLKALAAMEGGWGAGAVSGAGAIGIMQIMPGGYPELEAMYPNWRSDPHQNIMLGAAILASKVRENGGDLNLGTQRYLGVGVDPWTGVSTGQYLRNIQGYYQQLQQSGGSFGGSVGPINGMWGGNPVGNSFVQAALQYQGVRYEWASIPGPNQDPWQTGWDCSGFTWFMNQKYGDKTLPMGSHHQYAHAQQTGRLFTDLSQLQPGDLVFIDTGFRGGSGANLNNASHVGIYIGNGQMIHASNPSTGTIVSPLAAYGNVLGAMHQSGSGGSSYATTPGYGGFSLSDSIRNFLANWGR